jgi:carboxypeptidase Taq
LGGVSLDEYYRAINSVGASPIRVEADEVTYNLHIMLRFFLERDIFEGPLEVKDLPEAWNARSRELLGIVPKDDAEGVLQDIHWSMGAFGYFPTYTLGNLYASQFMASLRSEVPDLDGRLASGDLKTPLEWLRSSIHVHGRVFSAAELCRRVTGEALDPGFFVGYLREKYGLIYEL